MSEADLTDSTAPIVSPAPNLVPTVGSSMKTTSPRAWAAKMDMPIVPWFRVRISSRKGEFGEEIFRGRMEQRQDGKYLNVPVLPSGESSIHS